MPIVNCTPRPVPSKQIKLRRLAVVKRMGRDAVIAEFRDIGFEIQGQINAKGFVTCRTGFRIDHSASGWVNADTGTWGDRGSGDKRHGLGDILDALVEANRAATPLEALAALENRWPDTAPPGTQLPHEPMPHVSAAPSIKPAARTLSDSQELAFGAFKIADGLRLGSLKIEVPGPIPEAQLHEPLIADCAEMLNVPNEVIRGQLIAIGYSNLSPKSWRTVRTPVMAVPFFIPSEQPGHPLQLVAVQLIRTSPPFSPFERHVGQPVKRCNFVGSRSSIGICPTSMSDRDALASGEMCQSNILVEGPKDGFSLRSMLPTDVGGFAVNDAGSFATLAPPVMQRFAGRDVVLIPDNDDAGRAGAEAGAANFLAAGAKSVKIPRWSSIIPDCPPGYDTTDFLAQFRCSAAARLAAMIESTECFVQNGGFGGSSIVASGAEIDDDEPKDDDEDDESVGDMPEWLLRPGGLLEEIVHYHRATCFVEQPQFAIGCAIAVTATLIGNSTCDVFRAYPSIYQLHLADTAGGKNHTDAIAKAILEKLGHGDRNRLGRPRSGSGLVRVLEKSPANLGVIDEFGRMLKFEISGNMRSDIFDELLKLWSSAGQTYAGGVYSDSTKNIIVNGPVVNLIGLSVHQHVFENLPLSCVDDGFLPRFMVLDQSSVHRYGSGIWHGPSEQILNLGRMISGAGKEPRVLDYTSDAFDLRIGYLDQFKARRAGGVGRDFIGLYARQLEIAQRLAIVHTISADALATQVPAESLRWGWELASFCIGNTIRLAKRWTADSTFDKRQREAVRFVTELGGTVTQSQLTKKFQRIPPRERNELFENLWVTGQLCRTEEKRSNNRTAVKFSIPQRRRSSVAARSNPVEPVVEGGSGERA